MLNMKRAAVVAGTVAAGLLLGTAPAFAGDNYGAFLIPDVDQEVLVVLIAGDARSAVVVGALWNGATGIPETIGGSSVDRFTDQREVRRIDFVNISLECQRPVCCRPLTCVFHLAGNWLGVHEFAVW